MCSGNAEERALQAVLEPMSQAKKLFLIVTDLYYIILVGGINVVWY